MVRGQSDQQEQDRENDVENTFLNEIGSAFGESRLQIEHPDATKIDEAVANTDGIPQVNHHSRGNAQFLKARSDGADLADSSGG